MKRMNEQVAILLSEIRFAERLCQRTARLYRRVQSISIFLTAVGGSAVVAAAFNAAPAWASVVGAACFGVFGAAMIAVRPAEKAVANEMDVKRYAQLRSAAAGMDEAELRTALQKARESDAAEVEPLRDVAYNDVVIEIGRSEFAVPLSGHQKVLAALA